MALKTYTIDLDNLIKLIQLLLNHCWVKEQLQNETSIISTWDNIPEQRLNVF